MAQSDALKELSDLADTYVGNNPKLLDSVGNEALKLATEEGDIKYQSISNMQVGIASAMRGEFVHALHSMNSAWLQAKKLDNTMLMVNTLTNMSGVYQFAKQPEKAKQKLELAIEILKGTDFTETQANTYLTLSMVQEDLGELEESRKSVGRAMKIFHESKNIERYFYCVEQLGNLLVRRKEYDQAIELYDFAINGWIWKKEMGKLIALHASRGKTHYHRKSYTKAKLDLGFAYDLADSFNITHSNDTIIAYQLKAAATLGENHLIAKYTDRLTDFFHSREMRIADEKVAEMENDCLIRQHEMEMKLEDAETRLGVSEQNARRNMWLLAGGAILLLILLSVFGFKRR